MLCLQALESYRSSAALHRGFAHNSNIVCATTIAEAGRSRLTRDLKVALLTVGRRRAAGLAADRCTGVTPAPCAPSPIPLTTHDNVFPSSLKDQAGITACQRRRSVSCALYTCAMTEGIRVMIGGGDGFGGDGYPSGNSCAGMKVGWGWGWGGEGWVRRRACCLLWCNASVKRGRSTTAQSETNDTAQRGY